MLQVANICLELGRILVRKKPNRETQRTPLLPEDVIYRRVCFFWLLDELESAVGTSRVDAALL